ncbi:manganese and iron superoxide dismutase [Pilatotrama ljubarskyi]|nr:manganese and iron superoxide dismutase [Pilatotrama ljubarskyi]
MSGLGFRLASSTSRATRLASVRTQACRVQSRALHRRRQLSYPIEEGLGTFLPPHTLKMIAEDYQQGLLDRLNDQVRGTSLENKSIVQTVVEGARDPNKVLEFNYASEALNNSFFLECVKPPPANATSHEGALVGPLERRIRYHWGSLAHFQSSFSAAVLGMFSSGWVWLVTDKEARLGIMPTFGTGTLLVRSSKPSEALLEWQRIVGEAVIPMREDEVPPSVSHPPSGSPPPPTSPASGLSHSAPPLNPHTPARSMSSALPRPSRLYEIDENMDQLPNLKNLGDVLFPLLCVSVHEHAWVSAGYGVWGKEEYMKRFWTVVDWAKVSQIYAKLVPDVRRS